MSTTETPKLRSEVAQTLSLDRVRYSAVWEDHLLVTNGLKINADDDVLSVASAGTNVLAILLEEPRSVSAIDMNPAQAHLVELKFAGIEHLEHEDFVELMGVAPGGKPEAIYEEVKSELSPEAAAFWDEKIEDIRYGVFRCGRLDRYFEAFRRDYLDELWPEDLVERLFDAEDLQTQARIFEEEAFTPQFQEAFRHYYGRKMMSQRGRDPSQFRYVGEMDVGAYFLGRFHDVCTRLPLKGNFYVRRFLTGGYRSLEEAPLYLQRENFERLKGLLDRVTIVTEELETHLAEVETGTYSKANLSDVFEYMAEDASDELFGLLARSMRQGGRIAYWNLLVERHPPETLSGKLESLTEESRALWRMDRAWFYSSFHLEELRA